MASPTARLVRRLLVAATVLPFFLFVPNQGRAQGRMHHIGIAFGYQKLLSNDLKDSVTGLDFTNAGFGALSYRYSLGPSVDLTLDARGTVSKQTEAGVNLTLTNSFFGPGVRFTSPTGSARPFVQANFLFAHEKAEAEYGGLVISGTDNGAGFGVSGGLDITASELVSIPIEVNYMYAKPSDDISGVGVNVGVTFNFGLMNQ